MEHSKGEKYTGTISAITVGNTIAVYMEDDGMRILEGRWSRNVASAVTRMETLMNAFNGIDTHEAMNIAQVAIHLHDNPGDLRYMKHGKEMENLLRLIISLGHSLSDKYCTCPDCKNSIAIKALLSKLEGGE